MEVRQALNRGVSFTLGHCAFYEAEGQGVLKGRGDFAGVERALAPTQQVYETFLPWQLPILVVTALGAFVAPA